MERLCRVFLDKLIMAHQSRRWIATSKCSSCLQHIFFLLTFFIRQLVVGCYHMIIMKLFGGVSAKSTDRFGYLWTEGLEHWWWLAC